MALARESSPDHAVVEALLEGIEAGTFGDLDDSRLAAAGISRGEDMTSRTAPVVRRPLRSLAILSASWATCSALACVLPGDLPVDHSPTLFLHGDGDDVVPAGIMERYADQLAAEGHVVSVVRDAEADHAWLDSAPEQVVAWFTDDVREP